MNATLNSVRSSFSPRQWNGSLPMMPCRVCVVIGPFIGCHAMQPGPAPPGGTWQVSSNTCMAPAGSPRSQPSRSLRPSTWQVAQLVWPRPEVRRVSKRKRRPALIDAGVASWKLAVPTSEYEAVLMALTEPSKRLRTYTNAPAGSATTPVGPSPTSMRAMRPPVPLRATTELLPSMATNAALASGSHATPRGSPTECTRCAAGIELDA